MPQILDVMQKVLELPFDTVAFFGFPLPKSTELSSVKIEAIFTKIDEKALKNHLALRAHRPVGGF